MDEKVAAALEAMAIAITSLAEAQTEQNREVSKIRGALDKNAENARKVIELSKKRSAEIRKIADGIRGPGVQVEKT